MENFDLGDYDCRASESSGNGGGEEKDNGGQCGETYQETTSESDQSESKKELPQAAELEKLARDVQFFRNSEDGEAFASFEHQGHVETHSLHSGDFRDYLAMRFCEVRGRPPNSQALADTLNVLRGRALMNSKMWPVYTRVATGDGAMWLNLGDDQRRVVQITAANGWQVIPKSPVYFRVPKGMKALPEPVRDSDVGELLRFVNVGSYDDFILLVHWIIAAFTAGPYPILVLQGEQGTAKSTMAKVVRTLIDPSVSPIRSLPNSERDLMVAAKNGWVQCFDNVSQLSRNFADALCRLATGGGLSTRKNYTDDEEIFLDAKRPCILNGIQPFVGNRTDLIDRAIFLYLPPIPDKNRRCEREFWGEYEKVKPRILGAILDAVWCALSCDKTFKRPEYKRMSDFNHISIAATPNLPWDVTDFERAYAENRESARQLTLEVDLIAQAIQKLMDNCGETREWSGTMTELSEVLRQIVSDDGGKLPEGLNVLALSHKLNSIKPALRGVGIEIERTRGTKGARTVTIYRVSEPTQ